MRNKTILIIILALLVLLLALIVGARVGLIQHETAMRTLSVSTEAAASIAPSHCPVDEVDVTPPAPKKNPLPPTPEPTPEPTDPPVLAYEQPVIGQPEQGRYGSLLLTADEIETIARLVRLEAEGEPFAGQVAVAEVVLNRVASKVFPDNVYDVVYQTYPSVQFTPAANIPYTAATQTQYDAVQAALRGPNILPMDVCYFATSQNGRAQACGWIGNHCFCY